LIDQNVKKRNILSRVWLMLLSVGPGIFCIGYTIGTGSVTSMAKAGSEYGMTLMWVLLLSVFFSWILMEAYGRYAVVTGETAMYAFRKRLKFGNGWAVLTILGVVIAQWSALSGILGLTSNGLYEVIRLFIPGLSETNYWFVLGIAIFLIVILYGILLVGRYSLFEQVLIVLVTLMGLSFLISMFIVLPPVNEIASGFIPTIPRGGSLMVAAFVGTTMAAPTFVVRPLIIKEKGWGKSNVMEQSKDAGTSAILMFVISGSILVAATGALFHEGKAINKVLDMAYALEPVAGKLAVSVFMVGTMSAGISSIFPILMVAPLLIGDYRNGKMDTRSAIYKGLTGIACLIGLTVPIFGSNPIMAQIATQVASVFVLPLVIAGILVLINKKSLMAEHRAGNFLNAGLVAALIFSLIISYNGILGLKSLLF
jgi:manganese transport protein